MLYSMRRLGFEQLRKRLSPISKRVLSLKLKALEGIGIVRRDVLSSRPPSVEYSLTANGLLAARLAEPFFLFLRVELGKDIPPSLESLLVSGPSLEKDLKPSQPYGQRSTIGRLTELHDS